MIYWNVWFNRALLTRLIFMLLYLSELLQSLRHHRRWSWSLVFCSTLTERSRMSKTLWVVVVVVAGTWQRAMLMSLNLFRWNQSSLKDQWWHRPMLITLAYVMVYFCNIFVIWYLHILIAQLQIFCTPIWHQSFVSTFDQNLVNYFFHVHTSCFKSSAFFRLNIKTD